MRRETSSTRRSFLKGSALLTAPLAVAAPAAIILADDIKARLARLEDEAAIRELHHNWLRRINSEAVDAIAPAFPDHEGGGFHHTVCSIAADHAGQADAIEVAPDGKSAFGRFQCAVEIGTAIAQDCTLARMAHAQGSGFVRRTECRLLKVEYLKASGTWVIAKAEIAAVCG
jgi:hypothetical protein